MSLLEAESYDFEPAGARLIARVSDDTRKPLRES